MWYVAAGFPGTFCHQGVSGLMHCLHVLSHRHFCHHAPKGSLLHVSSTLTSTTLISFHFPQCLCVCVCVWGGGGGGGGHTCACIRMCVYACMFLCMFVHTCVHVVLCSIIPASFSVKLEFCIALSRAQGCLQLCELCQI